MKFRKIEQAQGAGNGGGLFVKFADGESRVGVLVGEIFEFRQKWVGGKSHVVDESDPDGKLKFRVNFITKEDGKLQCKILEFGVMLYSQFSEIADGYDIEQTAIKITRRGMGTDTTYIAMPVPPKEQPTPAQLKAIQAIPLNILEHKETKTVKNHAPGGEDLEVPF